MFGQLESGGYCLEAIVLYGSELFEAVFDVSSTGQVIMLSDQVLIKDLPFQIEAPLAAVDDDPES